VRDPLRRRLATPAWHDARHGGAYDETQYNVTKLVDATGGVTMRQRLEAFVAAAAHGGLFVRVDGWTGNVSKCGHEGGP
jgi:hypothetical protein